MRPWDDQANLNGRGSSPSLLPGCRMSPSHALPSSKGEEAQAQDPAPAAESAPASASVPFSASAPRRIRALALDMDGTILDSERVLLSLWDGAARAAGYAYDWDVMVSTVGLSAELTRRILEEAYPGAPHHEIRNETVRQYRAALAAGEVPARPGLMRLLHAARGERLAIGLCTSTRRATAEVALAHAGLAGWFDAMVCANEAAAEKPDPAPYLLMAGRLGFEPVQCLAVEDSPAGARSALRAGLMVAVVPDLVPPPPEVAARATVLRSLSEVASFLSGL